MTPEDLGLKPVPGASATVGGVRWVVDSSGNWVEAPAGTTGGGLHGAIDTTTGGSLPVPGDPYGRTTVFDQQAWDTNWQLFGNKDPWQRNVTAGTVDVTGAPAGTVPFSTPQQPNVNYLTQDAAREVARLFGANLQAQALGGDYGPAGAPSHPIYSLDFGDGRTFTAGQIAYWLQRGDPIQDIWARIQAAPKDPAAYAFQEKVEDAQFLGQGSTIKPQDLSGLAFSPGASRDVITGLSPEGKFITSTVPPYGGGTDGTGGAGGTGGGGGITGGGGGQQPPPGTRLPGGGTTGGGAGWTPGGITGGGGINFTGDGGIQQGFGWIPGGGQQPLGWTPPSSVGGGGFNPVWNFGSLTTPGSMGGFAGATAPFRRPVHPTLGGGPFGSRGFSNQWYYPTFFR
jgi:hypothetical protein